MWRLLLVALAAVSIGIPGKGAAQNVDHFNEVREFEQPPPLTSDRFRYGRSADETVSITMPRSAKPVPIVIWFPWPWVDMTTHQDARWLRSLMFDEGVATARISVTTKSSRSLSDLVESCARALAEIARQAPRFGYDPSRIILVGRGWGSHPAALFALDPDYAAAAGLPFESIRGILLIEPAGIDLEDEQRVASKYVGKQLAKLIPDPASLGLHSPAAHAAAPNAPVALILSSGEARERATLDAKVADVLRSNSVAVSMHTLDSASDDRHSMIGGPGHPANRLIKDFLDQTVR